MPVSKKTSEKEAKSKKTDSKEKILEEKIKIEEKVEKELKEIEEKESKEENQEESPETKEDATEKEGSDSEVETDEKEEAEEDEDVEKEEKREEDKKEEAESPFKGSTFGPLEEEKNSNSLLWKFIYLVAFFVGVGGAVLIFQKVDFSSFSKSAPKVEESVVPTEAPTPTEAALNLSDYPVVIENGSGIAGEAGRAQDLLEGENFTVESIGNAGEFDFTETVISAGSSVPEEFISALREALATQYEVAEEVEETGDEEEVLITVGSSKAE